ncbi:MAG: family tricarboxylate transporter, receptor protein [Hyphomicrobiales bacterium]|nr:family tricarboxylate transporter, receptor protein [Hyphomicrobiales bacterium]
MRRTFRLPVAALASALACVLLSGFAVRAQHSVEDFYRGRNVNLVVGYGPGGGYDVYARLVARHIGRFIPGQPNVVVQNMPGAGSLVATNFLFNTAPKDGSTFGTFARDMALMGVLGGNANARYDPQKFTWLGTVASGADDAYLMIARKDAAVKKIEDAMRPGGPTLLLGGTGEGAGGNDWANMLRDTIPLRLKVIAGYPDSAAMFLAIERKEIDGRSLDYSSLKSSRPDWLKPDSPVRVVLQFGRRTRHPDFPEAPTALELAPDDRVRALIDMAELSNTLSRPFAAPPGIPEERALALQTAFSAMCQDAAFRADAERLRVDVSHLDGKIVRDVIDKLANAPRDVRDRMRQIRYEHDKKGG